MGIITILSWSSRSIAVASEFRQDCVSEIATMRLDEHRSRRSSHTVSAAFILYHNRDGLRSRFGLFRLLRRGKNGQS